ncbi:hypothetical protein V0Q12_10065 [Limosilactobacillus reuteri]|uniref:hypothetical protein n=1 Tax=Limosilactobacillus reuteri TaxID=1598 RepID=UPI002E7C4FD6|nr:hypothetical protein [Limosilactobacillus reuteri]MEE1989873.1 hypothetical protein [Limosilactobacillus reuteri]
MKILTANDALKRLDELNVNYLTVGWYSIGDSSELLATNAELDEIFRILEKSYANDEVLKQLSAEHNSIVSLAHFETDLWTGELKALFYDEELNEIRIDL